MQETYEIIIDEEMGTAIVNRYVEGQMVYSGELSTGTVDFRKMVEYLVENTDGAK